MIIECKKTKPWSHRCLGVVSFFIAINAILHACVYSRQTELKFVIIRCFALRVAILSVSKSRPATINSFGCSSRDRKTGHTKTGYMEDAKTNMLCKKVGLPPIALRIGHLGSSALQNDGFGVHGFLQCRTPQETNPKGHWGHIYFS